MSADPGYQVSQLDVKIAHIRATLDHLFPSINEYQSHEATVFVMRSLYKIRLGHYWGFRTGLDGPTKKEYAVLIMRGLLISRGVSPDASLVTAETIGAMVEQCWRYGLHKMRSINE